MHHQQQAITKSPIEAVQEIPLDIAWEQGSRLKNCSRTEKAGVTVFTGTHPEHGKIHIIIPAFGEGLLLFPFVTQDF